MSAGLRAAFWRTLLIQASWGYDRMIGIGMAYAMRPLLPTDPSTGAASPDVIARSAGFFNAHPYLAGVAVGALSRAEVDGVGSEQLARLRAALSGPLGSIGDRLFWGGLLRAASGLGLIVAALASAPWAVAVFLLSYNIPHLFVRRWAIAAGWREGASVSRALSGFVLRGAVVWAQRLAALTVGMAVPIVAATLLRPYTGSLVGGALAVALAVTVAGRWLAPTLGGMRLALLAGGAALLGGALWP
ncbi:MAG TPA: PTS system mannose/fructose/sorbose family transporter subunit IID [Gemmatimonadales bacterium]|jgi:PTS system mannose-specific IID component